MLDIFVFNDSETRKQNRGCKVSFMTEYFLTAIAPFGATIDFEQQSNDLNSDCQVLC